MFNNIVYLNRDQDLDRREATENQCEDRGITATRFSAIEGDLQDYIVEPIKSIRLNREQLSCLISHLEIIRKYGGEDLLVFEDDVDLSPSDYWGTTFEDITSCINPPIGIAQLYCHPSPAPVRPRPWFKGMFGTVAYFIRSWYSQELCQKGYKNGKWELNSLVSSYVIPVADSVLYSNAPSISFTLFGLRDVPSTILPHATYVNEASRVGQSWAMGQNNIEEIKDVLRTLR